MSKMNIKTGDTVVILTGDKDNRGKTGKVIEQRGRAWLLAIRDGNADKIVIARPQHLRAQKL